jgi:hypothetical protein
VPLVDGIHTLTAKAADAAGNVSPSSAPVTITVDTDTVISITEVTDPITDPGTNAAAAGTAEPGAGISVVVSDGVRFTTPKTTTAAAGTGAWSVTGINVLGLANGTVTYLATATDSRDHTATDEQTATKSTSAPAPTVRILDNGDNGVSNPAQLRVQLRYNGPEASSDAVLVVSDEQGTELDPIPVSALQLGSPQTVVVDASSLADGLITAEASFGDVVASDDAILDRSAPAVDIDEPSSAYVSIPFCCSFVDVSGTAADTGSGVAFISVRIMGNGVNSSKSAHPAPDGTWSTNFNNLGLMPGSYTVEATAFDGVGNNSPKASITINVY